MISNEDLLAQRGEVDKIFTRAWHLYMTRDEKYKGLWSEAGAQDNAFQLRHKAMRVWRSFESLLQRYRSNPVLQGQRLTSAEKVVLVEDAFDMMNYVAFYIWCIENDKLFPADLIDTTTLADGLRQHFTNGGAE